MKYICCVTHDTVANVYSQPMFFNSTGAAIRAFTDEINAQREGNQLYLHPDDFNLYHLGTYDDSVPKFEIQTPVNICHGKLVKRQDINSPSLRAVNS